MTYRELVEKTLNPDLNTKELLANGALGLCGEAGEVADLIKKYLYQGHKMHRDALLKEMGDVRWYLELLCIVAMTKIEHVEEMNMKKLLERYPNGFSSDASVAREDAHGTK